jgi:competence ComEA-like helix-hairpin-helix protein
MLTLPFPETRLILLIGLLVTTVCLLFACAKRAHQPHATMAAQANDQQSADNSLPAQSSTPRININTASAKELETLPGIGKSLAERIIEHREKYGLFRRSEHLILVRGISDRRYRAFRNLISVE